MAVVRLTKSKRFNEVFHLLLAHNFPVLLKDLAMLGRREGPEVAELISSNGKGHTTLASRVRALMEDLGPTFIKIGQLLGTRPDLIPSDFIEEFKKMYDQTTPTPFPEVRRVVEEQLGRPLEDVFLRFEEAPIASASIGQVHRATLRDGTRVAVKAQHPGIDERFRTDFDILRGILKFTERVFAASRIWQPADHLEEIRLMLSKELDFRHEVKVQKQVLQNFEGNTDVVVPKVWEEFCTQRVVVMEFMEGQKLRAHDPESLQGVDAKGAARTIAHAMAKQIFVDRLFHADPSPGNLLLMGGPRVCFLDFGAFGHVTKRRARLIFELIVELNKGNLDGMAKSVLELCEQRGEYDPKRFAHDLERVIDYYENERPSPADPVLLQKIIDIAQTHHMLLPPDFMLITRALYQFDGMCKQLDPDYELVEVLTPFVGKVAREHFFNPEAQMAHLRDAVGDLAVFARQLPGHLTRIMGRLEKGELGTQVEIKGLNDLSRGRARLVYFGGFTLLLGFLMLGGALVASFAPSNFSTYVFGGLLSMCLWLLVLLVIHERGHRR